MSSSKSAPEGLSEAWNTWVVANLLRGQPAGELTQVLIEEGLPEDQATAWVGELHRSRGVRGAKAAYREVRRAHLLRRSQLRIAGRDVPKLPVNTPLFNSVFVAGQQPVVLQGATTHWPAMAWTWESLAEHALKVQASVQRDAHPAPDYGENRRTEVLPFSEIVRRVLDPNTGNDLYVTARDNAVEALAVLQPDILPIPGIVDEIREGIGFWIGATGAYTPLHYDTSGALMCPVLGRKRVWLIPPEEEIEESEHVHWATPVDLDDPKMAIRETDIGPGDLLFIPAGWWHPRALLCRDPG